VEIPEASSAIRTDGPTGRAPSSLTPKDELEHVWRYFALHAGQRLSMFNYFLVLFGLTAAGLAGCLRAEGVLRLAGVLLGASLAAIAYTFHKLDQRTSFLIKHAEASLRALEELAVASDARLFSTEPRGTQFAEATTGLWTYGRSFRFVFSVAAFVGVLGAALALALSFRWIG
jgi:phosphotransferase system  glucose/maltose/N-acetylglucosamine-specific IIC component